MLSSEDKTKIKELLDGALNKPVDVLIFSQKFACETCKDVVELMEELASLNDNIKVKILYLEDETNLAKEVGVDKVPAILIKSSDNVYNLKFFGVPAGYEFMVILEALMMASSGITEMRSGNKEIIRKIRKKLNIKVFVTPTCPYCPTVGKNAFMAALENPNITSEIIETTEYPQLVQKYNVQGVPKAVIDDGFSIEGAYPEDMFVNTLARIAGVSVAPSDRGVFDVAIIGGGGAGISAAIYAVRQGLKTALIERQDIGGQLLEASAIDNYLGLFGLMGPDMAKVFNAQLLKFDVDLVFDEVLDVLKEGEAFELKLKSGNSLKSKTVIVTSGMKHRKLEVDGETKLVGRGVSYCATCDGDLYRGKNVAVVGGGDTALSYTIYLSHICDKIYLIHRKEGFRAEKILLEQVKNKPNLQAMTPYTVTEIIGDTRVEKIKVRNEKDGKEQLVDVDAIFISIGYKPNFSFLNSLKPMMTEQHFIKVDVKMRTNIEGMFAAGDITGIETQLIVAGAQGATAALTAAKYLREKQGWSFNPIN
jgi:thioredoxin reductase (NADPH)